MPALAALGLTAAQEDVYLELIGGPPGSLAELRQRLPGQPADSLNRILAELVDLGLVTRLADSDHRPRFVPVPPDVALEALILLREERLARARAAGAELLRRYQRALRGGGPAAAAAPAEVVAGADAMGELVAELQRRALREVRMFDAPPYVRDPGDPAEPETLARGVVYRVIYDHRALVMPSRLDHLESMAGLGERPRVAAHLPMKLMLVDNAWALLPLWDASDVEGGVLIRPSILLEALSALFETWWSRAVPVVFTAETPSVLPEPGFGPEPSLEQRRLLALLAAGVPDERIGAVLRLSPRTLHRRVQALMRSLGVSTRFQIGAEATRRGWL